MNWIKMIATEVFGLFVDDLSYALVILAWVVIAGLVLPHLGIPTVAEGPVFFLGFLVLLAAGAVHKARQ